MSWSPHHIFAALVVQYTITVVTHVIWKKIDLKHSVVGHTVRLNLSYTTVRKTEVVCQCLLYTQTQIQQAPWMGSAKTFNKFGVPQICMCKGRSCLLIYVWIVTLIYAVVEGLMVSLLFLSSQETAGVLSSSVVNNYYYLAPTHAHSNILKWNHSQT